MESYRLESENKEIRSWQELAKCFNLPEKPSRKTTDQQPSLPSPLLLINLTDNSLDQYQQ